ncbi:MAG: MBL fold metallo-hydrolase [Parachlamydiales bacterium]|jgi:phosphoribosyl 1,2-cyclic phosphodiesterase
MGYCPLGSGSKGNCIYVASKTTKILIDAGLSAKATLERLQSINVDIGDIDAIVISHEHSDHIHGIKAIVNKYSIPLLANTETAKGIVGVLGFCPKFKIFSTGEPFTFGDIHIHSFSVPHDTLDPVMFTLTIDTVKLGICTDLGFATTLVQHQLQGCDYLLLESNHEPSMVDASPRPEFLKQRIKGRSGHLSNADCAKLLCTIAHDKLKHVHLAHLSRECNSPEKAMHVVTSLLKEQGIELNVEVAPQETLGRAVFF